MKISCAILSFVLTTTQFNKVFITQGPRLRFVLSCLSSWSCLLFYCLFIISEFSSQTLLWDVTNFSNLWIIQFAKFNFTTVTIIAENNFAEECVWSYFDLWLSWTISISCYLITKVLANFASLNHWPHFQIIKAIHRL